MSAPENLTDIEHLDETERECLELCQRATRLCEWCADECARLDGMTDCVRLCRDAADIASLHARFLARGSDHREALAGLCATICRDCAKECATHEYDHCQMCAEVLSDCAESCELMVA